MADDAGALLVRSGLVSSNALDDARARVATIGGTLGEQLVTSGAIADDDLTAFYRSRLLVPQVNPNLLARLTPDVVASIPSDMAIELRAVPVSLDADNNLTVAMSDPSDRHAVDEISFFTGAYVVRAVATQMQIAWCLAHYYGHVTALGQRLLRVAQSEPVKAASAAAGRPQRTKGLTGKVNASRHRAVAPVTGPVDVVRPSSGQLDLRQADPRGQIAGGEAARRSPIAGGGAIDRPLAAVPSSAGPAIHSLGARIASAQGLSEVALADMAGAARPLDAPAPLTVPGFVRPNPLMAASAAESAIPEPMDLMQASGALPMVSLPVRESEEMRAMAQADAHELGQRPTRPGVASGPGARSGATPDPSSSAARAGAAHGSGAASARPGAGGRAGAEISGRAAVRSSGSPDPSSGAHAARASGAAIAPGSPTVPEFATPRGSAAAPAASQIPPPAIIRPAAQAAAARGAVPAASPDAPTLPPSATPTAPLAAQVPSIDDEPAAWTASPPAAPAGDGAPDKPRARSISGEIRVPVRRAPSIKPPLAAPEGDDEEEPLIMIEMREEDEDLTGPRPLPIRRRPVVKSDPPELQARAGEVDLKAGDDRAIDVDEPRIVVDEDAFAPPTGRIDMRAAAPVTAIDVVDDADSGAVIHDRIVERDPDPGALDGFRDDDDDSDTGEIDVVMLDAPKRLRPERRTKMGIGPTAAGARPGEVGDDGDDDSSGPTLVDPHGIGATAEVVGDATSVDLHPAPPGEDTSSDQLAAPPAPSSDADTNPHLVAPPPLPAPPPGPASATRSGAIRPAMIVEDDEVDDDEDDEPRGRMTSEMTAAELDDAIPHRRTEGLPELLRRRREPEAIDDGWGPPGTTIPPPLLGAIPGSEDEDESSASAIPMPNVDSSPLLVSPTRPSGIDAGGRALVRALEDATARAIDVIRQLEHTQTRDEIVGVMISYLAETHHRAGFFVTKHAVSKDAGELAMFAMTPRSAAISSATLRLDRPSTLQDVVGTRLPYRGPMHDDASRAFLISVLGACPPEILLVPVTVRERVVGVLFGEHRQRHTFDDQLALAARAAGMALERILRARRS